MSRSSFFRRYYVLLAALFLLAVAVAWQGWRRWRGPAYYQARYATHTQRTLDRELAHAARTAEAIAARLEKNPTGATFETLNALKSAPYYLYRQGALYYWSDAGVAPSYQEVFRPGQSALLTLRNGVYLTRRYAFVATGQQYDLVFLVPLLRRYRINSRYTDPAPNRQLFPVAGAKVSAQPQQGAHDFRTAAGEYLFSAQLPASALPAPRLAFVLLTSASALLLLLYGGGQVRTLTSRRRYLAALAWLAGSLAGLRAAMLLAGFPFAWYTFPLFDPKYYASSWVSPSLGDLLLDVLAAGAVVAYLTLVYPRLPFYRRPALWAQRWRVAAAVGSLVATYGALLGFLRVWRTLHFNAQFTLDITGRVDPTPLRLVAVLLFVLMAVLTFLTVHGLVRWAWHLLHQHKGHWRVSLGLSTLLAAAGLWATGWSHWLIVPLGLAYLLLVAALGFPPLLRRFQYKTYLYFFVGAIVMAATGAYALYGYTREATYANKEKFAAQLLLDQDGLAEYLLQEAVGQIKRDELIRRRFRNPFASKELVAQKIRRRYLSNYFNKYDVQIIFFNRRGDILTDIGEEIPYQRFRRIFDQPAYRTEYPDVFFYNEIERNVFKRYLAFAPLTEGSGPLGYVVIDLRLKRLIPDNVYPELLVDKRFVQPEAYRAFSYAVYANGQLQYSYGDFNYTRRFTERLAERSGFFTVDGYGHLARPGPDGRVVVVSGVVYPFHQVFTNFSFLLVVLITFILAGLLTYTLTLRPQRRTLAYTARVQLYLNLAFFLPLLSVSVITLWAISNNYRKALTRSFVERAENVSGNLVGSLEAYRRRVIPFDELRAVLNQLARYTDTDINLYDARGRLVAASQPEIYERGLLAPYANPAAVARLAERQAQTVLLTDSVGTLRYNSAYVAVRSFDSGQLIGMVSLPFFESRAELQAQITDVLGTIINIFIIIFLAFLAISYFASQLLTRPLQLITRRLRRTTLGDNEPLIWSTDDEIGLLVDAYNKMLVKLGNSRRALARSEKESAWREMARQVAHEIKNPLTPMKLKLQYLQHQLAQPDADPRQLTEKTVPTLLHQIDTLSDIATSFSAFAQMPIPGHARFDLAGIVRRTVALYQQGQALQLEVDIPTAPVWTEGDEPLTGRAVQNLILNAIQAVPEARTPRLGVSLRVEAARRVARLTVSDNGAGIPEALREKVFVPNFSTKYAGSGIGLAVARRGVEHAGGRIWFETEEGVGTCFFVELPVVD